MRRVAVTGLGVVSSIGIGKDEFWNNLIKGKSGVDKVNLFDTSKFKRHYAGQIKNFNPAPFINPEIVEFLGRASQFSISAAKLALDDANIKEKEIKGKEVPVIIGTTMAEANSLDISSGRILRDKFDNITKRLLLDAFPASIPRNIGYFFGTKGVNFLIPNACSAGNYAISYGFDLVKRGRYDLVIVGGSEALSRVAFQGFQRLYAMAQRMCRPFDKNRKGMILGEGSGILVLESLDKALDRSAFVYAEVLGYGLSSDAYHMTIPKKEGIKKSIEKALKNSRLSIADIDYISAHGTGTVQNDKAESAAIKEAFGKRYREIPVNSIKSMLGHCMGAASAMEAINCCMAIKEGIIPPTINYKEPDPECDIDCVPNKARKVNVKTALNNGFAFGGNNCCVVFGKTA